MATRATALGAEPITLSSIADTVEVAPGVMMPRLGLGTWRAYGDEAATAVLDAFELGYRSLDTSANYRNEWHVGEAIARSGLRRSDVFVTTKLEEWDQGLRSTPDGLEGSLLRLGLDHVDLYLIHWPEPELTNETWRAMEQLQRDGLTRAIGVSNFEISDLEQLAKTATIPPAVNQIRFNPLIQRRELVRYCAETGIVVEAWEPLMRGSADSVPVLAEIGRRHGKTAAQISLRWILQKGVIAIPKTVHRERLRENADLYDFELSAEEMQAIDALDEG